MLTKYIFIGIAEPMQHLGHTFKYAGEFRIGLDPRKSNYEYGRLTLQLKTGCRNVYNYKFIVQDAQRPSCDGNLH